jgi:transcriptional regulator
VIASRTGGLAAAIALDDAADDGRVDAAPALPSAGFEQPAPIQHATLTNSIPVVRNLRSIVIVNHTGRVCRRSRYHASHVMPKPSDLLQGTLDLLILKTLTREPLHGWGISKKILQLSDDVLTVGQGSLYPALHRLEQQGWITAEWKETDLGRSAKFYNLTRDGRQQLERELESWKRLSGAVGLLLRRA